MKARAARRGASFEPRDLAVVGAAFDQSWAVVEACFSTASAEAARLVLANAILAHAKTGHIDLRSLKRFGLYVLEMSYPGQIPASAYLTAVVDGSRDAVVRS